jgi:hypothetical protein
MRSLTDPFRPIQLKTSFRCRADFSVLLKYSQEPGENATYGSLRKIESGDRQEHMFPGIKEISGFLKRYDFLLNTRSEFFNRIDPYASVAKVRRRAGQPPARLIAGTSVLQ